jgi:hypothetical protein
MIAIIISGLLWGNEPLSTAQMNVSGALTTVEALGGVQERGIEQGLTGEHLRIACRDVEEDLVLCLRNEDMESRWWLSNAELAELGLSFEDAVLSMSPRAEAVELESRTVHEGSGRYWLATHSDGGAESILFRPELLSIVGARPAVAVPERGVLVVWNRGDAELDRIMAVGVRQMYENSDQPVSSKVLALVDSWWRVWLQAEEN